VAYDSHSQAGVQEGDVIAGKYRVEKILGAGGMGIVVAARHIQLDEKVALKFLLPQALLDEAAMARFVREARAAVKIKSEHVARVTDVGTLETGAPFIVMEYLEGGDLAAWLKQRGPMPVEQAVEFVLQACVAVAEAHGLGIVHRDLKPANLFCIRRADGQLSIKVLDFGISKRTDMAGTVTAMAMTETGALMGSPLYMSPEQMRSAKDVDARTDIWALGVILFELMTGSAPFQAGSVTELAIKVANEPAPALRSVRPDVPAEVEAVVFRCLAKDRAQRYRNVGELSLALLPFAPKRAKASVERIAGIMQAAGLSESALAVPPSPHVGQAQLSGGTLPPVGGTIAERGRRSTILVLASGTGLATLVVAASFALLSHRAGRPQGAAPGAHPATSAPATALTAAEERAAHAAPPSQAEIVSKLAISAPASAEVAATAPQPVLETPKPPKKSKGPTDGPAAAGAAAASPTHPAPPTPSCGVVADYDADGQPHFRKVCK
jgi:hypothetical protein